MEFKMNILIIDDQRMPGPAAASAGISIRHPPDGEAHYVRITRSFKEGIEALKSGGPWTLLLLDHDLASYDEDGKEKTGYDVMCFLEANPQYLPAQIACCSSNPPGKAKIEQVIRKLYESR
jgi:hypothetical protein